MANTSCVSEQTEHDSCQLISGNAMKASSRQSVRLRTYANVV